MSAATADFREQVSPILERRCVVCHGPNLQSAGLRVDALSTDMIEDRRSAETWRDILNALNRGEMPPKGAAPLTSEERETVVGWLTDALRSASERRRATGGLAAMRRLNRVEYRNTMRDLLGLDLDYATNLPPDQVSRDGFKNNASALTISGLQLEYYLEAARHGLRYAIVEGGPPPVARAIGRESVVDKVKTTNWTTRLGRSGVFALRSLEFPDKGELLIRVKARAELPASDSPYPRMEVKLGYRADTQTPSRTVGVVDVTSESAQTFEFRGRIERFPRQSRSQSKYPGLLVWVRNVYSDGNPIPEGRKIETLVDGKKVVSYEWDEDPDFPKIVVESVEFRAPVYDSWPPAYHSALIPRTPDSPVDEPTAVRQALSGFLPRAFRRPVAESSIESYVRFFERVRPTVASFEEAVRETFAAALISPDFLYRVEDGDSPYLDDFELASRLSYLLWSTMPDRRLFSLAEAGRLSEPNVLRAETERMLADPRSRQFVVQFAGQWLDLDGLDRIAVNPSYYPEFDPALKAEMRREAEELFAELLRNNLSAMNLLRSDFTMANHAMARHYGLEGPRGSKFERIPIAGTGRPGGLLSQASILLSNSTGEDSHPIERGVWVRRVLLADPPPPPPPAVPNLADSGDTTLLPLKRQLELHRDNEACASCHRGIDPWGVALEEYDAVGLPRSEILRRDGEREERHPVDAQATLPDGTQVAGAAELADYLVSGRKRDFARALTGKLLAYALGRSLEISDEKELDRLTNQFAETNYGLKSLVTIITASDAFRRR